MTGELLAELSRKPVEETVRLWEELKRNKVFSMANDGEPYCRRMTRANRGRMANSANGKKGAAARWGASASDNSAIPVSPSNGIANDWRNNAEAHNEAHNEGHDENGLSPSPKSLVPSPLVPKNPPSPLPERHGENHGENQATGGTVRPPESLAEAQADAVRFAEAMGVAFHQDQSRMHWPDTLRRAVEVEGLSFERELLPAAKEARAKGKPHLAYALAIARSYAAEGRSPAPRPGNGTGPSPSAVVLPEDGDDGWKLRLRLCVTQAIEQGVDQRRCWPSTWGPFPFTDAGLIEPTTLVPHHILQGMIDAKRRQQTQPTG